MYKYATLYQVEEPEPQLGFPGRALRGMGYGLAGVGGLYTARKGIPWAHEKLVRGVFNQPGYKANWTRGAFNKVLGHPAAKYTAFALPLAYSLFRRD